MSNRIKRADEAHDRLVGFMHAQVEERKKHVSDEAADVFSLLVKASMAEGKYGLDDQELVGPILS